MVFLLNTIFKSIKRQPIIWSLLVINITIISMVLLFISALLNHQYFLLNNQKQMKMIALHKPPDLQTILPFKQKWEESGLSKQVSLLTAEMLPITFNEQSGMYSVSAKDKIELQSMGLNMNSLESDECVISYPLAEQFAFGQSTKSLVGQAIQIHDQMFTIVGIEDQSSFSTAFVSYEAQSQLANPNVTAVTLYTQESYVLDSVMQELDAYNPMLLPNSVDQDVARFEKRLLNYSLLALFLFIFAFISFIRMYQYKLQMDSFKWNMFYLLGAQKRHLFQVIAIETSGLTLLSYVLGWFIGQFVMEQIHVSGIRFLVDGITILIVLASGLLLLLIALYLLYRTIYKRGEQILAHLSA